MRFRTFSAGLGIFLMVVTTSPFSGVAADNVATPESAIPAPTGESQREVLVSAAPAEAPGETFELVRVTIPAGAVLAVHSHPGAEMATMVAGTLTYHVVANGSLIVNRADGTSETGNPGDTVILEVGDSLLEPEGMVHWAENTTDQPVVLIASSLFEAGQPISLPWEGTPVATPAD